MSAFGDKLRSLVQEHALVGLLVQERALVGKMASFSTKQMLQHLAPLVYTNDLQTIDQVICGFIPLSLYFHTVLKSSVAFALSR